MMKKYLFSIILLGASAISYAAPSLPIVKIDGKEYYCYNATKDDSLYGIAKEYGWDLGILIDANPDVAGTLKNNQRIIYPVALADVAPGNDVVRHKVKKDETVYGISKRYGVTVDAIYRSNPKAQTGINPGDILLIRPGENRESADILYEVRQGDTLFSLAKAYDTSVADIIAINKGLTETNLKAGSVIKIRPGKGVEEPIMASGPVQKPVDAADESPFIGAVTVDETVQTIPDEAVTEQNGAAKIVVILAQDNTRRDSEFGRGIFAALDDKKKTGEKIDVTILSGSLARMDQTMENPALAEADVILTTYDKDIPAQLRDFAQQNSVKLFNVFDIREEDYLSNPEMVHLLPGSDYFNRKIVAEIYNRFPDYTYAFVGSDPSDQIGNDLMEKVLPVDKTNIASAQKISALDITDNSRIVIYSFDTKKSEINAVTNAVGELRTQYPLAEILLVGRPNWVVYDDSMKENYEKADTYIPSRFYFNPNGMDEKVFVEKYKQVYNQEPTRSFPMYSVMGYDLIQYLVPAILSDTEFPQDARGIGFSPLQLDFNFEKEGEGYLNKTLYLLRFTPYGTVDKISVK